MLGEVINDPGASEPSRRQYPPDVDALPTRYFPSHFRERRRDLGEQAQLGETAGRSLLVPGGPKPDAKAKRQRPARMRWPCVREIRARLDVGRRPRTCPIKVDAGH